MENFDSLGLPKSVIKSLSYMNFTTPTPIQAQAIPHALEGKDVLGSAQTGTGKTGAFGIPLAAFLENNQDSCALVMAPTRELATQVMETLTALTANIAGLKSALLIGGDSMDRQFKQLRSNPRLIVGTPGRIHDHLRRRTLRLNNTEFLVLDETDRMLDAGFAEQIETILEFVPAQRQTLLFSATMPKHIMNLVNKYMNEPVRVSVGSTTTPVDRIKQDVVYVSSKEKYNTLTRELDAREGSIVVFVKTKAAADRIATQLHKENHSAIALHGDMRHRQRERAVHDFRNQRYRILIATDIVARGLDVPHIKHVVNYDLPQVAEDYIHRIGRTARAGETGSALCLITEADKRQWSFIQRLMNPDAKPERFERSEGEGRGNRGRSKPYEGKRFNNDRNEGSRSEGRSFGGERKSFGGKPSGNRSFGEKRSFGDRSEGNRSEGRSFGGERKSFGDKPSGNRSFGEKRSFGDRKEGGNSEGKRSFGGERKSFGDKPSGNRSFGNTKPYAKKEGGDRWSKPEGKSFSKGPRKPNAGAAGKISKRFSSGV